MIGPIWEYYQYNVCFVFQIDILLFICFCSIILKTDVSDETKRADFETKTVKSTFGYSKRPTTKLELAPNGKYLAVLFGRYCVIRSQSTNFMIELSNN